jgi:hypothetical protein
MLYMNHLNARHFRLLVCIPLLMGIHAAITPPGKLHISEAWPDGAANIAISFEDSGKHNLNSAKQSDKKISATRVVINEATHEQLMSCPGIGSRTAALIVKERAFTRFYDWRDLHDRVKGMSNTRIDNLKEAGVRINTDDPTGNR